MTDAAVTRDAVPSLSSGPGSIPLTASFVLKIAERCNLNCGYCYMYNKGDSSFLGRPKFMSTETAAATLARIAGYAQRHKLPEATLVLHGGEPLLIGRRWVQWFLEQTRRVATSAGVSFNLAVQTNGTLLDDDWLNLFSGHKVTIGISCDGPEEWNDQERRDFAGRGSYREVRRALDLLVEKYGSRWGVLTVVNPETRGSTILKHFTDIGVRTIDFIWPDFNHDHLPPWPPGMLADYYCELFDYWYDESPSPPKIRWFESAMSLLLGGRSDCDALGLNPVSDIMVESDGTWEPLDTLRICGNGMTRTGLDVRTHDVEAIWAVPLYQIGLQNQDLLAEVCRSCDYLKVCGGGYLPHRYRSDTGFANPSVYCADYLAVLSHIRQRISKDLEQLRIESAPA